MRRLRTEGYLYFPDENKYLVNLLIQGVDDDGLFNDSFVQPTESDIERVCAKYGLPFDKVLEIINGRSKDTHTIIIDIPVFLKYLEEHNELSNG